MSCNNREAKWDDTSTLPSEPFWAALRRLGNTHYRKSFSLSFPHIWSVFHVLSPRVPSSAAGLWVDGAMMALTFTTTSPIWTPFCGKARPRSGSLAKCSTTMCPFPSGTCPKMPRWVSISACLQGTACIFQITNRNAILFPLNNWRLQLNVLVLHFLQNPIVRTVCMLKRMKQPRGETIAVYFGRCKCISYSWRRGGELK